MLRTNITLPKMDIPSSHIKIRISKHTLNAKYDGGYKISHT